MITLNRQQTKVGQRFTNKGYDSKFIEKTTKEVLDMDRIVLMKDREHSNQQIDRVPIILEYNTQYKQIERIIQRHWHILQEDKHLHNIPDHPKFVYKKAPTIRDKIIRSVLDL